MNTTSRRRIAAVLQIALMPLVAVALSMVAATMPAEGGWTASGAIEQEQANQTLAAKPANLWTNADLRAAGYTGCVALKTVTDAANPWSHHLVRLPAAEGYRWVMMTRTDVAERMAWAGGTATTADDVKMAANCHR